MTKEHTPTPWVLDEIGDIFSGKICVAVILEDDDDFTNGNHIVKCVNMHDELVEALKKCGMLLEHGGFDLEFIDSALEKAGGESL